MLLLFLVYQFLACLNHHHQRGDNNKSLKFELDSQLSFWLERASTSTLCPLTFKMNSYQFI